MFPLFNHQNLDFDDVRQAIGRFFGSPSLVTIHDGDGCELFDRVSSHYCTGTVSDPQGNTMATFAIEYVSDEFVAPQNGRQTLDAIRDAAATTNTPLRLLRPATRSLEDLYIGSVNGDHRQQGSGSAR